MECRESLGRRKAAVLYCQSCVVPEWRWDVPGAVALFGLSPCLFSASGCGAVLGVLGGRGAEMGAVGNEALTALGSLSSPN